MKPFYFTRRTMIFFTTLLVLLGAFTVFEARQQHSQPNTEQTAAEQGQTGLGLPEAEAALTRQDGSLPPDDTQKRHLALWGERLCVYAGPMGGGGEMLQQLDIPLRAIPARWLAQLTNGGIEFPNEETLLMALDNLDELTEDNCEVMALPQY